MGGHEVSQPHRGTSHHRETDTSITVAKVNKEGNFHLSLDESDALNRDLSEEAAAQNPAEHEEEWDDEEDNENYEG